MNRISELYCRLLEALCALALFAMVVLVFGNVVMRYAFNSGFTMSEELSRWMFIWITFLGAVIAIKEHGHLGTDFVVARLPVWGKKACLVIGHLLMLYITWLLFKGSLEQTRINMDVAAPASGLPVGIVYAAGIVFSVSAFFYLLVDLWRAVSGKLSDDELVLIQESEEAAEFQEIMREHAAIERLDDAGNPAVRPATKQA